MKILSVSPTFYRIPLPVALSDASHDNRVPTYAGEVDLYFTPDALEQHRVH